MTQLCHDYGSFVKKETTILVVGPENSSAFRRYWEENNLPFIGLPDPEYKVLKLYGQQIRIFKFGRMPAQVLVDKNGIARFVHYGLSMSDIPDNASLLELIDQL